MGAIVVAGTPGAGKTTVLNEALKKLNLKVVNYGDEMFKYAKKKNIIKNRDELRKQSLELQKKIQKMAARSIAQKAERENAEILVDTHCTIKTPKGYLPGLPSWVLKELKPKAIVIVEASPREIILRRKKDLSRNRDPELARAIEEHQQVNRAIAMAYAAQTGATVKIIQNHKLEKAVKEMIYTLSVEND